MSLPFVLSFYPQKLDSSCFRSPLKINTVLNVDKVGFAFFLTWKKTFCWNFYHFNLPFRKTCASNYLKCKINRGETNVTFFLSLQLSLIGAVFSRERLKLKHLFLPFSDEIKLSLEHLPNICTLVAKKRNYSESGVLCNNQCHSSRRVVLVGVPFRVAELRSRPAPQAGAVVGLDYKKGWPNLKRLGPIWNPPGGNNLYIIF